MKLKLEQIEKLKNKITLIVSLGICVFLIFLFINKNNNQSSIDTIVVTPDQSTILSKPSEEILKQTQKQESGIEQTKPFSPTSKSEPPSSSPPVTQNRIEGLARIEIDTALLSNWDTDKEKDGIAISFSYLDKEGEDIDTIKSNLKKMPVSADVKIYAGDSVASPKNRLVFSGHFADNQIVYGGKYPNFSPEIRIPKEKLNIRPTTDYQFGKAEVVIHTPEQGDFSATDSTVQLYDPSEAIISLSTSTHVEGLAAIRINGGIWENWDADAENDGPFIKIVYLDSVGDIIANDVTKKMLISADVKVYAGYSSIGPKDVLLYSNSYTSSQIILGNIYPKIRIPKERLTPFASSFYKYGAVEVTIYTPEQGNFSAKSNFIVLYE